MKSVQSDNGYSLFGLIFYTLFCKIRVLISPAFILTRAVQPVATCHQLSYLHKPAILIVTSFSLWHHSRGLHLRGLQPAIQLFSLWRHSHCDVIRYWAGHAQCYGRTYVTYGHLTAFNI